MNIPSTLHFQLFILLIVLSACTSSSGPGVGKTPFERLSEYHFFKGDIANLSPEEGVLPYDLNSPLFTDYAEKARFVWMPKGKSAQYTKDGILNFPEGTALIKNFYYHADQGDMNSPKRIVETRLLIKGSDTWEAHGYIWNDEQTDASLEIVGDIKKVEWTRETGADIHLDYIIPNKNQCKGCHYNKGILEPIGPKVRNLNKTYTYSDGEKNQLEKWAEVGYLTGYNPGAEHSKVAQWDNPQSGSLHERAMAYLDINCAHCHNPNGPANTTGLNLVADAPKNASIGIMKASVAAGQGTGGFDYNIVPGHPEISILPFRMASDNPAEMMPELGRRMVHQEGVELIREWIREME
ncbi:MAG: hypothetical protein KDE26_25640 [Bacteroidetes bacterium]|nr:hypothetical protein [Bacteroidota bacterium]